MKSSHLVILSIILITVVLIVSCNKDELYETNDNQHIETLDLQTRTPSAFDTLMDEFYLFHNGALDTFVGNLPDTLHETVISAIFEYNDIHGGYDTDSLLLYDMLCEMEEGDSYIDTFKNQLTIWLSGSLETEVLKIFDIFSYSYRNNVELYDSIVALKGQVITGEVYTGIEIALASYDFWTDLLVDDDVEPLVQADCLGYLFAWGSAWWNDQGPNYSNSWEAQKKRMGLGLIGAAAYSTGVSKKIKWSF